MLKKLLKKTKRAIKTMIEGTHTHLEEVLVEVVGLGTFPALEYKHDIPRFKKVLEFTEDNGILKFILPSEGVVFSKTRRGKTPLTCAYNATNDYIKSHFGKQLDEGDREWFINHPHLVESGLPSNHTFDVIQELVRPYGLGISKVYVKKGSALSTEQRKWKERLGCNPSAMTDSHMSNQDYLDKFKIGDELMDNLLEEEVKDCNFEYVNKVNGPAIICTELESLSSSRSASWALGGGHASYLGTRKSSEKFRLAIKLDYLSNCKYNTQILPFEEVPENENKVVDIFNSSIDGKKISSLIYSTMYSPNTGSSWQGSSSNKFNNYSGQSSIPVISKLPVNKPKETGFGGFTTVNLINNSLIRQFCIEVLGLKDSDVVPYYQVTPREKVIETNDYKDIIQESSTEVFNCIKTVVPEINSKNWDKVKIEQNKFRIIEEIEGRLLFLPERYYNKSYHLLDFFKAWKESPEESLTLVFIKGYAKEYYQKVIAPLYKKPKAESELIDV
jgi:hypothetical protein